MKELFKFSLIVIVGVAIIDLSYRFVCNKTFENAPKYSDICGGNNKFYYVKEPYNIIVIGASKAESHYKTKLIEETFGLSSYNFGGQGGCILQQYLCLLSAFNNGGLKHVILDITPNQLSKKWIKDKTPLLYPFYWSNDTVRAIVNEVEGETVREL